MLRSSCLYCGGELVRWAHWGICPSCSEDFLRAVAPPPLPSIKDQIDAVVGPPITQGVPNRPPMEGGE